MNELRRVTVHWIQTRNLFGTLFLFSLGVGDVLLQCYKASLNGLHLCMGVNK